MKASKPRSTSNPAKRKSKQTLNLKRKAALKGKATKQKAKTSAQKKPLKRPFALCGCLTYCNYQFDLYLAQ